MRFQKRNRFVRNSLQPQKMIRKFFSTVGYMDELTSRTQNIETFIITVRFPKNFSQLSSSDQDWESSLEHTSFLSRLMRGRWIPKDLFMLQFDKNIKICLQTMQTNLNLIRNQVMQLSNKKVVQFFESCKNSSWRKNQKNKNKRICYFSKKKLMFFAQLSKSA